jgi:hypothetical protein
MISGEILIHGYKLFDAFPHHSQIRAYGYDLLHLKLQVMLISDTRRQQTFYLTLNGKYWSQMAGVCIEMVEHL